MSSGLGPGPPIRFTDWSLTCKLDIGHQAAQRMATEKGFLRAPLCKSERHKKDDVKQKCDQLVPVHSVSSLT